MNYINKFDIIIITGVLHHLKDREEIKLSLSNIIKYTKKGSLVFLVEPRNSTLRKLATIALIKSPEFIFKLLPLRCYLERELLLQEKIEMNKYLAYAHLLNQDFKKYNIMPVTIKEDWKMQYNVYVVN